MLTRHKAQQIFRDNNIECRVKKGFINAESMDETNYVEINGVTYDLGWDNIEDKVLDVINELKHH